MIWSESRVVPVRSHFLAPFEQRYGRLGRLSRRKVKDEGRDDGSLRHAVRLLGSLGALFLCCHFFECHGRGWN